MEQFVQIPLKRWMKIEATLERIDRKTDDWVDEETAASILNISVLTLRNRVYDKTMQGKYRIGALGKRFYNRQKLTGE